MTDPNWAQIATAAIALLALFGAYSQIRLAKAAGRRNLAYEYFKRFNDPMMIKYKVRASAFLNVRGPREATHWEQWTSNRMTHRDRLEIVLLLNFFEELAGMYNRRLIDRDITREAFYAYSTEEWDKAWWFIERCRRTAPRTLEQWRLMNADLTKCGLNAPDARRRFASASRTLRRRSGDDRAVELERERRRLKEYQDWMVTFTSASAEKREDMLSVITDDGTLHAQETPQGEP